MLVFILVKLADNAFAVISMEVSLLYPAEGIVTAGTFAAPAEAEAMYGVLQGDVGTLDVGQR